jgi:hypothetical protein
VDGDATAVVAVAIGWVGTPVLGRRTGGGCGGGEERIEASEQEEGLGRRGLGALWASGGVGGEMGI